MDHPFRHATCDMSGLFTSPHAHQQAPQPAAAKHRWTDEAPMDRERGCNDVSVAMECHPTSPWSDSDSFLSPTIQVLRSPCNLVDTGATQRGSVCVCPPLDKGFRPTNPLVTFTTVQFHSRGIRDVWLGLIQRSSSHSSGYSRGTP